MIFFFFSQSVGKLIDFWIVFNKRNFQYWTNFHIDQNTVDYILLLRQLYLAKVRKSYWNTLIGEDPSSLCPGVKRLEPLLSNTNRKWRKVNNSVCVISRVSMTNEQVKEKPLSCFDYSCLRRCSSVSGCVGLIEGKKCEILNCGYTLQPLTGTTFHLERRSYRATVRKIKLNQIKPLQPHYRLHFWLFLPFL